MSTPTSHIAIIGGSPGGLTLACILQKHGIHATVYEQEHSANACSQGGFTMKVAYKVLEGQVYLMIFSSVLDMKVSICLYWI